MASCNNRCWFIVIPPDLFCNKTPHSVVSAEAADTAVVPPRPIRRPPVSPWCSAPTSRSTGAALVIRHLTNASCVDAFFSRPPHHSADQQQLPRSSTNKREQCQPNAIQVGPCLPRLSSHRRRRRRRRRRRSANAQSDRSHLIRYLHHQSRCHQPTGRK